jgi:hypothetical protein
MVVLEDCLFVLGKKIEVFTKLFSLFSSSSVILYLGFIWLAE